MAETKTVAEMLREKPEGRGLECWLAKRVLGLNCGDMLCALCYDKTANALADMIEAEQAELRKQSGVDVDALLKLADHFEALGDPHRYSVVNVSHSDLHLWKANIRDAVKDAKPQLPEGVIWPTYEDGELVRFGGVAKVREDIGDVIEVRFHTGKCSEVTIAFEDESTATHYMVVDGPHLKRPEPEVFDADGVPIHVGNTVWNINNGKKYEVLKLPHKGSYQSVMVRGEDGTDGFDPDRLTHRKPDTLEDIERWLVAHADYAMSHDKTTFTIDSNVLRETFDRVRKLMCGE